eukprot:Platyproteum_vivax@DN2478_c0_g1_i3.p1
MAQPQHMQPMPQMQAQPGADMYQVAQGYEQPMQQYQQATAAGPEVQYVQYPTPQPPAGYVAGPYAPMVQQQPEYVDYSAGAQPQMVDQAYGYMQQANGAQMYYPPNVYQQAGQDMYGAAANPNYYYDYMGQAAQYDQYGGVGQVPYQWNPSPAEVTPTAAPVPTAPRSTQARELNAKANQAGNRSTKPAKKSKSKRRLCC